MKIFNKDLFNRLPDGILFDTDNTLYPYDSAHNVAINAVRNKVVKTFTIKPKEFDTAYGKARDEVKGNLKRELKKEI